MWMRRLNNVTSLLKNLQFGMKSHMFIEPDAGLAEYVNGILTIYVSTQNPHFDRVKLPICWLFLTQGQCYSGGYWRRLWR